MKGNEGWLGPVQNDFILRYFEYLFQYSWITYILVAFIIGYGLLRINRQNVPLRIYLLFTAWFFIPFIIGFLYSRFINNVLQFSVLIFGFPYLLFIIFGHYKARSPGFNSLLVAAILAVNIFSLFFVRNHYSVFYNSQYIHMLTDQNEAAKIHKGIPSIIDSDKKISRFYIKKYDLDTNFTWFDHVNTERKLIAFLDEQSKLSDFLYLGCLSYNSPTTVPIIREYYPSIEVQRNYSGGTSYIFSKSEDKKDYLIEYWGFDNKEKKFWKSIDMNKFIDTIGYSGMTSYLIDNQTTWSPSYTREFDRELNPAKNDFIDISVKVYLLDSLKEAILSASITRDEEVIHWAGTHFDRFIDPDSDKGKWTTIHYSVMLSDVKLPSGNLKLKVFIWNKGGTAFLIDDFTIHLRKGNPVIYGLVEKIVK